MDYSINNTLEYILFLTRHIQKGNTRAAALALLMDLGFPEWADGFGYLIMAVVFKAGDLNMRVGDVYRKVVDCLDEGINIQLVEQGIRSLISEAWKYRDMGKWILIFPPDRREKQGKPTNGKVIAKFGCLLDLWTNCSEEASYARI